MRLGLGIAGWLLSVLIAACLVVDAPASAQSSAVGQGQPSAGPQTSPARSPLAGMPAARSAEATARPSANGLWIWLVERQRELTTAMTSAVRRLQGADVWTAAAQLGIISFLYGIFHAAGPGHGKFVISSYALANARTLRRGVAVSFMAAFLQAISAIVLVTALAVVARATSLEIKAVENWLEAASWGLIAVMGAWLLWGRVRPLLQRASAQDHGHSHGNSGHHHHDHGHDNHHHHHHGAGHSHHTHRHDTHDHGHHHHTTSGDACSVCGHAHAPAPADLQGQWSWRQAWSLAFAVGIRPCTGAIVVLVFSLGIGLFAAGVFATFAMAIGTAITVSALATLAVTSRDLAARLAGSENRWAGRVQTAAGIVGSLLILVIGTSFFLAALSGSGPL